MVHTGFSINDKLVCFSRPLKCYDTIDRTDPGPINKAAQMISRWSCFDQWWLSSLLDFGRMHVCRRIVVQASLSITFAVAPSRLDDPSLLISRLPLPASLQAPGKLEAWEYMSFCVDDNRV